MSSPVSPSNGHDRAIHENAFIDINVLLGTAIIVTDHHGYIVKFNHAAEKMFLITAEEAIGKLSNDIIIAAGEIKNQPTPYELFINKVHKSEWLYIRRDGSEFWGELTFNEIKDEKGDIVEFISVINDITEKKIITNKLEESSNFINFMVEQVPVAIYMAKVSPSGEVFFTYFSKRIETLLEIKPKDLIGINVFDSALFKKVHPDDIQSLTLSVHHAIAHNRPWRYDFRAVLGNHDIHWLHGEDIPQTMTDGTILRFGFIKNIDERKDIEIYYKTMSMTDPLTKIANRLYLEEHFPTFLNRHAENASPFSIMMIDIDNFKKYNDLYGHVPGDECIKRMAALLTSSVRSHDILIRFGGEEFLVMVSDCTAEQASVIAERIRYAAEQLFIPHTGNPGNYVTLSIGVTSVSPPFLPDCLVRCMEKADAALYQAKGSGRNRVVVE